MMIHFRPRRGLALLAAALLLSGLACARDRRSPPPEADPTSRRTTQQGELVGFSSQRGAHVWRGIPFAKPPVGDLRWRAPQAPDPWRGTLEALSFGPPCVQFAGPGGGIDGTPAGEPTGSEDCLHLNIYAPRFEPGEVPEADKRLPVMFWIHGGGNTIGDAFVYDGSRLALSHDLILVTLHYRLGVFGWFAHRALRGEGTSPDDRSGNYGTLDLVQGLRWVQQNIAAFGGDPGRVTVFGESAGGSNTFSMLLSPRASGLFHRAIVESGGTRTVSMAQAENPVDAPEPGSEFSSEEVLLELLVRDGRAKDRDGAGAVLAGMSDTELSYTLRGRSAEEMLQLYRGDRLGGMYEIPRLLRDGAVLPAEEPLAALAQADGYNQVPVILGSNRDENKLFLLFTSPWVTRASVIPLWLNDERRYQLAAEYLSLMWKATGVDEPAMAMRAVQGASVYAYRFDWDEEPKFLWSDFSKLLGAAHAFEIPFVFGGFDLGPATRFLFDEDKRAGYEGLSESMMSYWAEFANTGDPGRGRSGREPQWSPWDDASEEAPKFIVLDTREGGGIRMASGAVTRAALIARVAGDSRFASWQERCGVYRAFVQRGGGQMDAEAYASVGEGACRAYPIDSDPWED
jgi:para-nitrobenzyl esterase